MRRGALILAFLSSTLGAQDLRERALEQERRALERERLEQEKQRSVVEEQRRELATPVEKKRDPKACENARVNYQATCGSPTAPKYRSPKCRDAEIFLRENC